MSKKVNGNDLYEFLTVLRRKQIELEGTKFEVD